VHRHDTNSYEGKQIGRAAELVRLGACLPLLNADTRLSSALIVTLGRAGVAHARVSRCAHCVALL
jgi:hypothetical protein